ncbi:MAG: chromosome segregation protein SMC, partial [Cyclobacteriaceae bacterium]|nr:chromosome segregation protein SMC [Cyclobacteriaceae bacterium]
MLLNKLEIKGFKSFGDKVTINFDEGITGIVGPNGCGKSNVVDSIRWVLGEQKTKTLRSEKMENIIFNGTKSRKATQMAEVSLSFKNTKNLLPTEYSEVTISRRYFRSGESEYLLNGITCRLKDITNLFLDTGIASNSYAIIELGMVDDILNNKDNSRRALFEQAAGISKFKKRKKETLKKLEDTDLDLERVDDLLFEIDKNMKSLEKQARQTEKYYQLKEEYKTLSLQLASLILKKQNQNIENFQKQIENENDKRLQTQNQITTLDSQLEKAKTDLILKEKTLSSRQKTLNGKVAEIRHYENEKKIKSERLRFLNDKTDSLKEQIELDKKSSDRASFSIKGLYSELEEAEKQFDETKKKKIDHLEEFERAKQVNERLKEEVDTLRKIHRNKQEESYQINKSLEIKEIQINSLKKELEKTSVDSEQQNTDIESFEGKIFSLEKEIQLKTEELQKLKKVEKETLQRITDTEKTIEVVREELSQANRKLDARQNEYSLTKSLVENLEGFPEAIKFLSKKSGWNKKAPLLSDILTTDDNYKVTIENYLEPFLNYYIVDTEAEAYQAINILSDAAKGKAHFFILDSFKTFKPSEPLLYDHAFPATEIVEFESKYNKLISFALNNVYIVEGADITDLNGDDSTIFITKSGKYTKRKFSLSGGSVGLFDGKKIGRAKNLDKLKIEIKNLEQKINHVNSSLTEQQDSLQKLKDSIQAEKIEILQDEIHHLNEQHIAIKTRKEQFVEMINRSDLKKEDIEVDILKLTKEIQDLTPTLKNVTEELDYNIEKLGDREEEYEIQNQLLSQKSITYNEINVLYHQKENQLSRIAQEIEFKSDSLKGSQERIEKNQLALEENDKEIRQLHTSNQNDDHDIIDMLEEKENLESALNESEKEYYAQRGSIDEFEKEQRELQRKKERIDEVLSELKNSLSEVRLENASVSERLSVEFNIKVEDIVEDIDAGEITTESNVDQNELRGKVEKIKNKIDAIGPINPMAMEAYNEIKERNDFIVSQKEDLVNAKNSLLATIDEIDAV